MFIEDIKNDFYNVLLGNRVLLLVHYDVDAICACKILQDLFKCDNISYTLVPVGRISELKTAYEENNEEIKYVVLINCGGTIDLVDILQPEDDVVFFVLDSHKPTDICNVYSDGQVKLIYKDEEENIPNFDDIFRDDDEEQDDSEHEGREGLEAIVERRRERKAWEERRHTLMFNYMQFSYYGKPSACVAVELAERASRCGTDVLWAGAVACASHSALLLRRPARLLLDAEPLQRRAAAARSGHIVVEKDVWLPLYRWWSVEEAITHSAAMACKLRLHSRSGATRLRQLLADMGFPLAQARQSFRAMDVELRRGLCAALEGAAAKLRLPAPARLAFLLKRPHAPVLAAHDLVYALMALIEHESIPPAEGFQLALSALCEGAGGGGGGSGCEALRRGVSLAQGCLRAAAALAAAAHEARALRLAGPFAYYIINEGAGCGVGRGPLWAGEVARWLAAGAGARPVLLAAARADGTSLLLGVPPRPDLEPRNLFGAAFEQAAAKSGVPVSLDYVDSSVVILPTLQRAQFLDALTALLA